MSGALGQPARGSNAAAPEADAPVPGSAQALDRHGASWSSSPCLGSSPDTLRLTGVGSQDNKGDFAESFYASAAAVSRLYEEQSAKRLRGRSVPLSSVQQKRQKECKRRKRPFPKTDAELVNGSFAVDANDSLNFDTAQCIVPPSTLSLDVKSQDIHFSSEDEKSSHVPESKIDATGDAENSTTPEMGFLQSSPDAGLKVSLHNAAQKGDLTLRGGSPELAFGFFTGAASEDGNSQGRDLALQSPGSPSRRGDGEGRESLEEGENFACSQELFTSQETIASSSSSAKSDSTQWDWKPLLQAFAESTGSGNQSLNGKRSRKRKKDLYCTKKQKTPRVSEDTSAVSSSHRVYKMAPRRRSRCPNLHSIHKSEEAILLSSAFQYLTDEAKRSFKDHIDSPHGHKSEKVLQDFDDTFSGCFLKLQGFNSTKEPSKATEKFPKQEREDCSAKKKNVRARKQAFTSEEVQSRKSHDVDMTSIHQLKRESPELIVISDSDETEETNTTDHFQRGNCESKPLNKVASPGTVKSHEGWCPKSIMTKNCDGSLGATSDARENVRCDQVVKEMHRGTKSWTELSGRAAASSLGRKHEKLTCTNAGKFGPDADDGGSDETVFEPEDMVVQGNTSDPALEDAYLDRIGRTVIPETEYFMGSDQPLSQRFPGSEEEDSTTTNEAGRSSDKDLQKAASVPGNNTELSESPSRILKDLDSDRTVVQETEFFMEYDNSHPKDCPSIDEDEPITHSTSQNKTLIAKSAVMPEKSGSGKLQDRSIDRGITPAKDEVLPRVSPSVDSAEPSEHRGKTESVKVLGQASVVAKNLLAKDQMKKQKSELPNMEHSSADNLFPSKNSFGYSFGGMPVNRKGSTNSPSRVSEREADPGVMRCGVSRRKGHCDADENEITVIPDTECFMEEDSLLVTHPGVVKEKQSIEECEPGRAALGTGNAAKSSLELESKSSGKGSADSSSVMLQVQDNSQPQKGSSADCPEVKTVLQPSQAFHIGREEAVLALLPGQVDCVLEQPFLACLTPSSLSVWTQNTSAEWVSEVDWLIDLGSTAMAGILVPSQSAVLVPVTTLENCGLVRVWMFVYHWMSGNTDKIKVDIPLIICYRVSASSMVFLCGVGEGQLVVMANGQGEVTGRKHCLTDSLSSLALGPELEGREGRLLGLQAVRDVPSCVLGLTADQHLIIWDHSVGVCLQSIDIGTADISAEHLVFASSYRRGLLLALVASGAGTSTPGCLVLVNPLSGQAQPVQPLQPTDQPWPGVRQAQESEGLVLMVDREGQAGLWSAASGCLLTQLPCSAVHSMAVHTDTGLAFVASELTGCVHTYSFSAG